VKNIDPQKIFEQSLQCVAVVMYIMPCHLTVLSFRYSHDKEPAHFPPDSDWPRRSDATARAESHRSVMACLGAVKANRSENIQNQGDKPVRWHAIST
jgi:hypothetical protein